MEGRILTSDVRLPTLEAEDAFMISKIAKYVQRIDKQVNTEYWVPSPSFFPNSDLDWVAESCIGILCREMWLGGLIQNTHLNIKPHPPNFPGIERAEAGHRASWPGADVTRAGSRDLGDTRWSAGGTSVHLQVSHPRDNAVEQDLQQESEEIREGDQDCQSWW